MKTSKYGLQNIKTGKLIGYTITSNGDGGYCGDTTVKLCETEDNMWLVDTAVNAEYVRNFSTPWYNSSEKAPEHNLKPKEWKVVEVVIKVEATPVEVRIPTLEEYVTIRYEKTDPGHLSILLKSIKSGALERYDWNGLMELFLDGRWNGK